MTPEEFREAYLAAQNGLGNDLQTLVSLSKKFSELATKFSELADKIPVNYSKINEIVEDFIDQQEP
ncbi:MULTISPECIES: hypothetical protein [Trichocoleus]|uniref:Uncharacterized protein n=1 Tax=Trichocoleus desertorum GB2-A4 TaxID=2933944 RepID=A0ABV0JE47_9CYAN|nr:MULTISPECIES: hypothetical protein [unclassified Trichocoleus]MBD1863008.1 hypothetical protein [Trichocoleus sp. FACHB-46]MBD2094695.1 hypothetical protein [Trichocoleus sp. FACHB-591]MBD2120210.1 hypothetical protein [Trichocoleus sp. FACHB-262]